MERSAKDRTAIVTGGVTAIGAAACRARGCFNMCRALIEGMRERRFERIVSVSSINGLSGQFGQINYAAAKAGVIGFS